MLITGQVRTCHSYPFKFLYTRYTGFKEVIKVVALPDKPSVVALIDVDKVLMGDDFTFHKTPSLQGNLMDILQQKFLKSIPFWDGTCSKDGRYGLYAPATGGMEMLDLRTGKVCKTLIPKVTNKSIWVAPNVNCSCRWRKESLTYLQYSTRQTSLSFTTTGSLTLSIFWTQYVNSGRKTIRAFRRKDGKLIANFRVQVSLLHLNLS